MRIIPRFAFAIVAVVGVSFCVSVSGSAMQSPSGSAKAPASSGPSVPDSYDPGQAFWDRQARLDSIADGIDKLGASDPKYGSVAVDASNNVLTVYTSSGDNTDYGALIPDDITLTMAGSVLNAVQVRTLTQVVENLSPELGVEAWGSGPDGEFEVDVNPANGALPQATMNDLEVYGPKTVEVVQKSWHPLASRVDDRNPYYGGARLTIHDTRDGNYTCSSGFSAYTPATQHYSQITAWHCMNPNRPNFFTGDDQLIGPAGGSGHPDEDTVFYSVPDNQWAAASVYDNPGTTGSTAGEVVGSPANHFDDQVCADGSYMRKVCGLEIDSQYGWEVENGFDDTLGRVQGWLVASSDGHAAVARGDSGGPVISVASQVQGTWYAKGIISETPQLPDIVACPQYVRDENANEACFGIFGMFGAHTIANDFGVQLEAIPSP